MLPRIAAAFVVLSASMLVLGPRDTSAFVAPLTEDSVEFQDGAGSTVESLSPGDTAVFFIRDDGLSTTGSCTGAWTEIASAVASTQSWSLVTGVPQANAYVLSGGCPYDTAAPANTPLRFPLVASVNGVNTLVTNFDAEKGEFTLLTNVEAGSTLRVDFTFDLVDQYSASDNRARIHSTSDEDGEWVGFGEVESVTDASASPASGLFRGEVSLSGDISAAASGDGAVWVQDGDTLTVTYYQADGATVIASHSVNVANPTPLPGATSGALAALASALIVVLLWRRRASPSSNRGGQT